MSQEKDSRQYIKIRGANEHNLKNVDVDIPRDKLVVLTYDQYVVSLYGAEDLVDTFRDKFTAAYGDASVAYDEAIA